MAIRTPIIIVNFKTYEECSGMKAVELAKLCEKASKTGCLVAVAVQAADISRVAESVLIPVMGQHTDGIKFGANTGSILPESLIQSGAAGTLLNHSERKLPFAELEKAAKRCKELGLITVVCAATSEEAEAVAKLNPDFIAIEPPELIGGDISVSTAKPELVKETVEKVHKIAPIPILCGAGVKTAEDVRIALNLGTVGVLLASGVTKAANPEKALKELISGTT